MNDKPMMPAIPSSIRKPKPRRYAPTDFGKATGAAILAKLRGSDQPVEKVRERVPGEDDE